MTSSGTRRAAVIEGNRTRVCPTVRTDLDHLARWWADPVVMTPMLRPDGIRMSRDEWTRWFNSWCPHADWPRRHFMIVDERDSPIGEIYYSDLDRGGRRASIGVKIGESGLWGKGYATDAVRAFCTYMFDTIGVDELVIDVAPTNIRALNFWRKMGFVTFARGGDSVNMRLRADTFRQYTGITQRNDLT